MGHYISLLAHVLIDPDFLDTAVYHPQPSSSGGTSSGSKGKDKYRVCIMYV